MNVRPILRLLFQTLATLFLFPVCSVAQNLVPNPGFEDYYNCPQSVSEVPGLGGTYGVKNWSVPGVGSSDYYNTCSAGMVGVPLNIFGYQMPHNGNAYVGCFTMLYFLMPQFDTYREYVETQLMQPLQKNQLYNVSFYVNAAATNNDPWLQGSNYSFWGTDGIGAYLSGSYVTGYNLFAYTPQIQQPSGQIITDTADWTLVSGFMVGNGEQYITVGNYRKYQQMAMAPIMQMSASPGTWYDTVSYMYIDDVSVVPVAKATNDTTVCDTAGFSKVLKGYSGGTGYLWNTGDTTAQITVHNTGTYWYQVHFGSYVIKDTINISYHSPQQMQAILHDTAVCAGSSISVKAPDGYSAYEWHANGAVYHTQTVQVYTAGTVVLRVSDTCGFMTDSFNVRFIQQHPLTYHFPDTTVCIGTILNYQAPASYLSCQWQVGNTTFIGLGAVVTQPGMVVLQVTDSCITYADTFMVFYQPEQTLAHHPDTTICNGTNVQITAPGGYNNYGWQYNGNTYNSQNIIVSAAGKVVLHVSDICGMQTDSFMIGYKTLHPLIDTLKDTVFCSGASLHLTAPTGYLSYAWVHNGAAYTSENIAVTTGGTYILQVKDSCVMYADSFYVREKPVPLPPITADTTICRGAAVMSLPVKGTNLLWYSSLSDPSGTVSIPPIPAGVPEAYIYVTQTAEGCESGKAAVRIGFLEVPEVRLPADTAFCQGDHYRIGYEDSMAEHYLWSSGETTAFIYPAATGTYELTAGNSCGSSTVATNIVIAPCDKCFWLPDAFTPNRDGRNDLFGPVKTCPAHFHHYLFRVYNRWGQVVFESLSPEQKWDGSFAGQAQPLGTYNYSVEYRTTAVAQVAFIKGSVELVR